MNIGFIDIVCDQHKRDHFVTRYEHRWEDGTPMGEAAADWRELPPPTARQRREHAARPKVEGDDLAAFLQNISPTGKGQEVQLEDDEPVHEGFAMRALNRESVQARRIVTLSDRVQASIDGRQLPVEADAPEPGEQRTAYPNQCTRCPANAPLRGENMGALLDGFAKMSRTRVTLRELNDAARRVRDTRK